MTSNWVIPDEEIVLMMVAGVNIGILFCVIAFPDDIRFQAGMWIMIMIIGTFAFLVSKPYNPKVSKQ